MTKTHELKTWPEPFHAIWHGSKKHEIRKNDRQYQVGDEVLLREFDPDTGIYWGRKILAAITYLTPGGLWGLPEDICVFSIEVIERMN